MHFFRFEQRRPCSMCFGDLDNAFHLVPRSRQRGHHHNHHYHQMARNILCNISVHLYRHTIFKQRVTIIRFQNLQTFPASNDLSVPKVVLDEQHIHYL